ncbi:hypothetical protein VTJ83DRAFT_4469 [Remersonia thermophila]|uniref:Histone transcription regulator 3 homolog n=1 Tax=Remersonia thermophila TaxID=72144 RepID=A0ABR4DA83_9PEZI
MVAFTAINVEPEDNIDEEVDTTKEIQVEDALKLFQNALKLHSQGPQFFDQAADAYNALFESEIFRYPESKTDYERAEAGLDGTLALEPALAPALPLVPVDVIEPTDSGLPQALYLSYKNHGQFLIDRIKHKVTRDAAHKTALLEESAVQDDARRALDDFCAALDRDPSDAELWRKAARVASFLGSTRVSRYSLEAAIELDDDPAVDDVEPPSLAEAFAGEQLRRQLGVLGDDMALSHPIMKPFVTREMPPRLARFLDPIPFLPDPTTELAGSRPRKEATEVPRLVVSLSKPSWTELGNEMVRLMTEDGLSARAVTINLPDAAADEDVNMEEATQSPASEPPAAEPALAEADKADEMAVDQAQESPGDGQQETAVSESTTPPEAPSKDQGVSTRKRSQSIAGIGEPPVDESTDVKRSKRTRRRDTAVEEAMDSATLLATQLQPLQAADQNLFQTTKNILENLGVTDQVTLGRIAEILDSCASDDRTGKIQNQAAIDLQSFIGQFDEELGSILLNKRELPQLSLSSFLEHAKAGAQRPPEAPAFDDSRRFRDFAARINQGWNTLEDLVFEYVNALARSYTAFKWTDQLKAAVMGVIGRAEEVLLRKLRDEVEQRLQGGQAKALSDLASLTQMLFELYLEVCDQLADPNHAEGHESLPDANRRMDRWLHKAVTVTRMLEPDPEDSLVSRFLWAAVTSMTMSKAAPRDHILNCWYSLRDFLARHAGAAMNLPNNAALPEISAPAADREISKLTTMDFFLGLFQEDAGDPVSVIESLEPVLNPDGVYITIPAADKAANPEDAAEAPQNRLPIKECASQELVDLWKFLRSSSTELRLLLWSRLGEAYGKIQYTTKQFSCFLRSIEVVVADLESDDYAQASDEARRSQLMGLLKALDDLVIQSLHLALNEDSSFHIIDGDHLKSSMSALAKVSCLLHVAAMHEDETRVGVKPAPAGSSGPKSFLGKLQEMQVRTWSLQYTMLREGIHSHPDVFPKPENDLADYLAAVHQVLGLRRYCKLSNKVFLRMMRVELLKQKNMENWEDYLGQVLYDLYGLKLGVGIWEVQDHGCEPENLEKRQALQLVERVTMLANRMSMKDLLKSDLKATIERMQQAIGSAKSSPQMAHNLRNYSEYLKAPINPLHLYQALTGSVELDAVAIHSPESAPAKQGWFFLLGMIALTRFKTIDLNRRQTPGATDDLRIAATFLRLQLQYTPDRWDAWFRLAECFDYELEEAVLWTADKMNKERAELVKFQRNAIHSYIMALSHSYSWASDPAALASLEDGQEALYDMYHEFGMRLYSSSREPFAMEPFQHSDQKRFFIELEGGGTYKGMVHNEMTDYQVWKFAAHLFRRAMKGKPKDWKNPYMVAKCLWKMYQKPDDELDERSRARKPTVQSVLDALEKTITIVASLPKPRHGQDPILEPHYKIVSVVHKLVLRGDLPIAEAAKVLQRQPYAPDGGVEIPIANAEEWEAYVVRCLRFLRDKDKSNWQHRLIMRHARVLFDPATTAPPAADGQDPPEEDGGSYLTARAAFFVLRESMFTKTMVMNVWKCDAERPGRHHVFTERYIRYMVGLLDVLNDRANLEAVLRRIRKKSADFYHFNELWQFCVLAYLKLIRQAFKIPPSHDEAFKSFTQEEFEVASDKITAWSTTPPAEGHAALNAMKEAVELKKLNSTLMKAGPIDDLITDCYWAIYQHIKPDLAGPVATATAAEQEPEPSQAQDKDKDQPMRDSDPSATPGAPPQNGVDAADLRTRLLSLTTARDRAGSELADKSDRHSVAGDAAAPRKTGGVVRRAQILRQAELAVQAVLRAAEAAARSAGGAAAGGAGAGGKTRSRVGSMSSLRTGKAAEGDETEEDDEGGTDEEGEDLEMKDSAATAAVAAAGGGSVSGRRASLVKRPHAGQGGAGGARAGAGAGAGGNGGGDGEESDVSSPPGSVHDDADDESDLSDVPEGYDDEPPPSLLFPNLRRSVDAGRPVGSSSSSSESGSDESGGEEEEEEEEEGEEGEQEEEEGEEEEEEEEEEEGNGDMTGVDLEEGDEREDGQDEQDDLDDETEDGEETEEGPEQEEGGRGVEDGDVSGMGPGEVDAMDTDGEDGETEGEEEG